jgi:hypothetical protein
MKKFTQPGTFSIIVLVPIMILCIVLLLILGMDEPAMMIIFSFIILIFILCLLTFYKLTIIIDDTHLTFRMGIGMINKSYPLSEIESCTAVKNPIFYGIGIHMTTSGWLYNVSGSSAIELTFKNRKGSIRIGTNKPDEIAGILNERIDNKAGSLFYEKSGYMGIYLTLITLALVIVFPILLVGYGTREPEAIFSESSMTLSGMYGIPINYADILQSDTLQSLPQVKSRTNGFAAGKVLKGNFKLHDHSKAMLFVKKGVPPYIYIKTIDKTVYLNFEDTGKTREVFKVLREKAK